MMDYSRYQLIGEKNASARPNQNYKNESYIPQLIDPIIFFIILALG